MSCLPESLDHNSPHLPWARPAGSSLLMLALCLQPTLPESSATGLTGPGKAPRMVGPRVLWGHRALGSGC